MALNSLKAAGDKSDVHLAKIERIVIEAPTYSTFSLGLTASRFINEHARAQPQAAWAGAGGSNNALSHATQEHDVAVMGSRGMGKMQQMLHSLIGLGSVSEYCVSHITCPVLVVKPLAETAK